MKKQIFDNATELEREINRLKTEKSHLERAMYNGGKTGIRMEFLKRY